MHVVGKIVKLESFKLESSFQVLVYTWKIVKLESSFRHKTFQFNDLSNYPFQLHVDQLLYIIYFAFKINGLKLS